MNSPVDLGQLRLCPLQGTRSELEDAAVNYIGSFAWSGELLAMYEGFAEPDILGVFLVQLRPSKPQVDEWLWVVVGDLPPAYLVADDNPTVAQAVAGYADEMQRWVDAARAGASVERLIPVNVPPTKEYADMLSSRLSVLRKTVLDEIRATTEGPTGPSSTTVTMTGRRPRAVGARSALNDQDKSMNTHPEKRHRCIALIACFTLALSASACAHAQAPAGPRLAIAVAPVGFGPNSGLTMEEQGKCEFVKEFLEELDDEVGQSFALTNIGDPRGVPGLVLVMRFAQVEGMSGLFSTKRIVLEGQMLKDGTVAADFMAMRDKGPLNRSRGFQTTCSIMEDLLEDLAEDVGQWLYKPTMNARLGDLSPR